MESVRERETDSGTPNRGKPMAPINQTPLTTEEADTIVRSSEWFDLLDDAEGFDEELQAHIYTLIDGTQIAVNRIGIHRSL